MVVSPERKIKDEIREAYKQTYPNIIFTLTNNLQRKDETIERLLYVLKRIINDLPTNRDWLDPDLEKEAREIIKELGE